MHVSRLWLLLLWLPGTVLGQQWTVDSSHITFKVKNAGVVVVGSLSGLNMQMEFDPGDPQNGQIKATLQAATINTGIRIRDNHLRRQDYFNVEEYPLITMRSREFTRGNPHQFSGMFALLIKGTEKEVVLPFSFVSQGRQAIIQGSFEIDRRDYQLGSDSMILSDQVMVEIWVKLNSK